MLGCLGGGVYVGSCYGRSVYKLEMIRAYICQETFFFFYLFNVYAATKPLDSTQTEFPQTPEVLIWWRKVSGKSET